MPSFSESLPLMLLRAREAFVWRFRPILNAHAITEQQWRVLRALDDLGKLSAAQLAAECAILAPSMTRILRKLSEQGFVNVAKSNRDQRVLEVTIAPRGRKLFDQIRPLIEKQYAWMWERLGAERITLLRRELAHLVELAGQGAQD